MKNCNSEESIAMAEALGGCVLALAILSIEMDHLWPEGEPTSFARTVIFAVRKRLYGHDKTEIGSWDSTDDSCIAGIPDLNFTGNPDTLILKTGGGSVWVIGMRIRPMSPVIDDRKTPYMSPNADATFHATGECFQ